jgi:hypothetical protein
VGSLETAAQPQRGASRQPSPDPASPFRSLLEKAQRFFSHERRTATAAHVTNAAQGEGTRHIKVHCDTDRSSELLRNISTAFELAREDQKPALLLSAVRIAYRNALTEKDFSGAKETEGKNHEMTISTLNSKLSRLLSNPKISDDDLQFIQKSVKHFEHKLPSALRDSLQAIIQGPVQQLTSVSDSSKTTTLGAQVLQSPESRKRDTESERVSSVQPSLLKTTLHTDQLKLRSSFESRLRKSFENDKKLPLEWIVSTASTVFKRTMLEHSASGAPIQDLIPDFRSTMTDLFQRKFQGDAQKSAELAAYVEGSLRAALRDTSQ